MKRTVLPTLAFVVALLTGCPDPREAVNFDTDPRVLRGSWNFVLSDVSSNAVVSTQAIDFKPIFVSESYYSVTASVTLEGETYVLGGEVNGKDKKFVRPQYQPVPGASFILTKQGTTKTYNARIDGPIFYLERFRFFGRLQTTDSAGNGKSWLLEIVRN